MTVSNQNLFVNLLYRLKSLRNAALLQFLIEVKADEKEYAASALILSQRFFGNQLSPRQIETAIKDLVASDLISTRVHAKTKTYLKVNIDQVKSLLNQPLPLNLPGMGDLSYPFLSEWQAAQDATTLNPDDPEPTAALETEQPSEPPEPLQINQ